MISIILNLLKLVLWPFLENISELLRKECILLCMEYAVDAREIFLVDSVVHVFYILVDFLSSGSSCY